MMNSSFCSLATFFLLLLPIISATRLPPPTTADTKYIRTSCNVTLYPSLCYASLSKYAKSIQSDPAKLARASLSVSLSKARHMVTYVVNLSRQTNSAEPKAAAALKDCYSVFDDAVDQMQRSIKEMKYLSSGEQLRFQMSNVQTWMSAALTNEETCTDGFEEVMDGPIKADVIGKAGDVKKFTSNGLALVNNFVQQAVGYSSP
ncbi:hypothetical protein ACHQM5_005469 [Ranunculus cassubicifolius]